MLPLTEIIPIFIIAQFKVYLNNRDFMFSGLCFHKHSRKAPFMLPCLKLLVCVEFFVKVIYVLKTLSLDSIIFQQRYIVK